LFKLFSQAFYWNVKRDPSNTDWQRDLVVSYVKMSEILPDEFIPYTQKALDIVEKLSAENRWYPEDHWILDMLKKRLAK